MLSRLIPFTFLAAACGDGAAGPGQTSDDIATTSVMEAIAEQRSKLEADVQTQSGDGAYAFSFAGLVHEQINLAAFEGRPILVVNTASKCGFTPQYAVLQETYEAYKEQGLVLIGVPSNDFGSQEPGSADEIETFCRLNYGVTFLMAAKSVVQGAESHPFYAWAKAELGDDAVPRWNFHKILIDAEGRAMAAFPSSVRPTSQRLTSAIETALTGTDLPPENG